jgi:hypothetical protein
MKKSTIIIIIFIIFLIVCAFVSYSYPQIDNFSVQKGPVTVLFLNPPEEADADYGTILGNKVITCDDSTEEDAKCSITYEKI